MPKLPLRSTIASAIKTQVSTPLANPYQKTSVALSNSEERFRQFIENAPAPIAMMNSQMQYLAVSRRWYIDYGLSNYSLIGRSHYEFFPTQEYWQQVYQRCLTGSFEQGTDDPFLRPDGSIDWVNWNVQPWHTDSGEIGGLILFTEILTERKHLADILQQTQQVACLHEFAMDKAADAVFWMSADAKINYVNEAACCLLGYTKEELFALNVWDINPGFHEGIWLEHWRAIKRFQSFTFETTYRTKENRLFPVEVTVNYLEFDGCEYHCAFVRDITDRKQAEADLQQANDQLYAVLDAVPGLVSWMNSDLQYLGVNRHLSAAFNLSPDVFMGQPVGFLEKNPKFAKLAEKFFAGEDKTAAHEVNLILEDGEQRSYLVVAQKYHKGSKAVFVGIDITKRKQAETELKNAKDQLQAVLDAVPGLVSWMNSNLQYLGVNRHLAKAFKLPAESFAYREVGFMESRPGFAEFARQFFASSQKTTSQEVSLGLEGTRRNYLLVAQKYNQGESAVFVGLDITERKQMEAELRRSKNLYRTLARNFPNGAVCLFDFDLRYTLAEGTELVKIGLSKKLMQGKTLWEVFPPETASLNEPLYRAALAGEEMVAEIPFANQIYLTYTLPVKNEQGEVLAGLVMTQNITESKRAEEALRKSEERFRQQAQQLEKALQDLKQTQTQLIQTEKMSSLGQLVAGVAHEINNPVSFIYGNLAYARQYTNDLLQLVKLYDQYCSPLPPEIQAYIEDIGLDFLCQDYPKLLSSMQVGADRIREVVLSLRNFSRIDEVQKKPVDIHTGIDSTLLILQNRIKAKAGRPGIEVIKKYGDLPLVSCYAGQLNQVFMNLLSNAIDAVEDAFIQRKNLAKSSAIKSKQTATIQIITEIIETSPHVKFAVIRIQDNGLGMNEESKKRIFEPFYTTKPEGRGTGLGLSISTQIVVDKHGGQLLVDSTLNEGTEFRIVLPVETEL